MLRNLLFTSALSLLALPAFARENHALIVAASEYQNLAEKWWLKGPKNDATLVSTYLLTEAPVPFAPENVTVLTDDEGYDPATLANIRAAFAELEATVEKGDFVYLHFSGHGTQAPAKDPDSELDGLDELFLPVDIGKWNNTVGVVENALVDDEIGALIDGLRAKGADVWVVFDSCHSGTATRAVTADDEEVMMRQLPDEVIAELGIPDAPATTRAVGGSAPAAEVPMDQADESQAAQGEGMGALIAFYAAQTTEVTPEKRMPKGSPDRKSQGVFTYTLFETLAEFPAATYGQIAQEVLRKYAVGNLAKSTPLFEGNLDATVFGAEPGERVAQWAATVEGSTFTIPAGSLHGLALGDELAVMPTAADTTDKALGYVKITSLDTFTATAAPVEKDGMTLPAELPKGLFLRRLEASIDFSLTVALPEPGSVPADALLAVLEDVKLEAGPRLNFVAPGAEADLILASVTEDMLSPEQKSARDAMQDDKRPAFDALWILPGTGLIEDVTTTPTIDIAGVTDKALVTDTADTLAAMAKVLNLMKLGAAMGPGNLDVEVEMQTKGGDETTLRGLSATEVPVLVPDDQVHVLARNNMDVPVDVNVLYIGSDYSITHWYAGRLQPGDELKKGLFKISDSSLGQERMFVVVTPAKEHSKVEDLSYLAQDAVRAIVPEAGQGLDAMLDEAGFGQTTRGAIGLDDGGTEAGPGPMILQIEVRTRAE
ncbi:caspase family protein [Neotabrizicola sp. VNH66]|uniref:caspase family protein n=1 Tax=Neotabrizicola sp. VNH66 TaxID=3400918 RepID=UPI003C078316